MKLFYNNWFDNYIVTESTEVFGFPIENTQQQHLSRWWKTTSAISQYGVADATTAVSPTCAFISTTNLTASAVVKIQGHTSDTWTSPDVDITMTRINENLYYALTGFSSKRYWRFSITDPTNTDGYIIIGRLWLGDTVPVIMPPSTSFNEQVIDTSVVSFSGSGQSWGDLGYRYKIYELSFPHWDNTMKDAIETFLEITKGGKNFFVAFDENHIDKLPIIYSIVIPGIQYEHFKGLDEWSSNLTFREVF